MLCSLGSLCSEIKAKSMLWLSSSLLKQLEDDIMPLTFHVKMLQKGVVIRSRIDIASMNEVYSFILKVLVDSFIYILIIIIFIIVVSIVRPGIPLLLP